MYVTQQHTTAQTYLLVCSCLWADPRTHLLHVRAIVQVLSMGQKLQQLPHLLFGQIFFLCCIKPGVLRRATDSSRVSLAAFLISVPKSLTAKQTNKQAL